MTGILLSMLAVACVTPEKLMTAGRYDDAIIKCVKKLRKNKGKEEFALILEKAYKKANQQDRSRINFLKREGNPDSWVEIFERYDDMKRRQHRIEPILPVPITSQSRNARFERKDYDKEMIEAKKNAAEFLFNKALLLLDKHGRLDAREAHGMLQKVKSYYPSYPDVDQQIERARFLGTNKVWFRMENTTGIPLPPDFEKELMSISMHDLNRGWIEYHTTKRKDVHYDYEVIVRMKIIDVSPEQIKERTTPVTTKVREGYEFVYDENGEIKREPNGDPVKVPKYVEKTCMFTETIMTKAAHISGTVDYYNKETRQMIGSFPVATDAVFEYIYARANGHLAALSKEQKALLKNRPVPFPPDFDLLFQAGEALKPLVKDLVYSKKHLVRE